MMDSLRRHAKGWLAKILIGLLALSFAIWGINDVFTGFNSDAIATVGDQNVSRDAYQQRFEQQVRLLSRQTGQAITPEQARQAGLDRQVLGELIRDAALREAADELGLAMPSDVVASEIAANPAFQNARGQFDPAIFRRLLQDNNLTEQGLLQSETDNRRRQILADAVSANVKVPDAMVEAVWRQINETRSMRWFSLSADTEKVPAPTDADLEKFHADNQALFTAPAYRALTILSAEPADLTAGIEVTAEEVAEAFERRKEEYGTPERRLVQQLAFPNAEEAQKAHERIKGGLDFMALAKERGVTEQDATLGDITRNAIPDPALADAAFALAEGEVSAPVKARLATVLLRVTKITPGTQKPLEEVKVDVEQKLKLDKAKDLVLEIHDKVEDARAGGASFEEIAADLKLRLDVLPPVDAQGTDKDGKPPARALSAPVLQAAFESDVGVENDPVATPNDGFVWFEVREVTPSAVRPLAEVRDQAATEWKKREARLKVLADAKALAERAAKGEAFDTLAQGANIQTATGIKRAATDVLEPQAVNALFSTPENTVGFAPSAQDTAAFVFEAGKIETPAFDANSEDAKQIRASLARSLANDSFAMYMANLQQRLGVSINTTIWDQVNGTAAQ